jgi:hypothetical protein
VPQRHADGDAEENPDSQIALKRAHGTA